ncbi:MAG: hypothetical protein A2987_05275 [Omnitrophica bacterium RIFCSPLOWO2_01_FULL_45_10]|nr:MAG: hypothetical protein A2987_05275 [Omnitrophica bacterium RIFCSPLOWO2_01_FULL_45_10]
MTAKKTMDEYLPKNAVIEEILQETADSKTLTLRPIDKGSTILKYRPGQFMMVSLPGYGEAPFTFASLASRDGRFQISVRKVGSFTNALHALKERDIVGLRGPYGNTFPLSKIENKNILFIAGGCGIAPLRPLIQHVFKNRKEHGRIEIIYGCRAPRDIFYKNEIESWRNNPDTAVHLTVDEPDQSWDGTCGVVCVLLPKIKLVPKNAFVFLCGPGIMIKLAIQDILKLGFKEGNIYASLERHMKCGVGKCGHCYVKGKYVCTDGPNFSYSEMKKMGIDS